MSALYNEYLTGSERELAVIFAESDAQIAKLNVLFDTVNATLEANMIAVEAKVLAENGTYDDLTMLYREAGEDAATKKQGIISALINAIKGLFAKIGNFFKDKFGKTQIPESIEIDKDVADKVSFLEKSWNNIQNGINKLKNKDASGAWDILKAISLPAALAGGSVAAGAVVVWKRDVISAKVNSLREKYNFLDTAIKTVEGWWNSIKTTVTGGDKSTDEKNPPATTDASTDKKSMSIGDALKDPLGFIKSIAGHISSFMGSIWAKIASTLPGKKSTGDGDNNEEPEIDEVAEESVSIFGVTVDSDELFCESEISEEDSTELAELFAEL